MSSSSSSSPQDQGEAGEREHREEEDAELLRDAQTQEDFGEEEEEDYQQGEFVDDPAQPLLSRKSQSKAQRKGTEQWRETEEAEGLRRRHTHAARSNLYSSKGSHTSGFDSRNQFFPHPDPLLSHPEFSDTGRPLGFATSAPDLRQRLSRLQQRRRQGKPSTIERLGGFGRESGEGGEKGEEEEEEEEEGGGGEGKKLGDDDKEEDGTPLITTEFIMGYQGLTIRSLVVGVIVGFILALLTEYFFLHLAEAPGGNYTSSILSFVILRSYSKRLASKVGDTFEFGASENLIAQTVATGAGMQPYASGLAGPMVNFKCSIVRNYAEQGVTTNDNLTDCYDPSTGQLFAWTYLIAFYGIFCAMPLYRQFIVKDKLPFPDGIAISKMLAALHSADGDEEGTRQATLMGKTFIVASAFQFLTYGWGLLENFPLFGIVASRYSWNVNMDTAQLAFGILVPFSIVVWLMVGTIFGWGIIGPVVQQLNDTSKDWDYDSYSEITTDFVQNVGIFIILTDGLYELARIIIIFGRDSFLRYSLSKDKEGKEVADANDAKPNEAADSVQRAVPKRIWMTGLLVNFIVIVGGVPFIFPPESVNLPAWQVAVAGILSPLVATSIVYGYGITNQLVGSAAGKLGILIFQLIDGRNSSVLGPMALGAFFTGVAAMAGSLSTDFKAAYLLRVRITTMFYGQLLGALTGATATVAAFKLFVTNDLPNQQFPLVYSSAFRNLALAFSQGLPPQTIPFILSGILVTLLSNILRDILCFGFGYTEARKYAPKFICIGLGFYLPPTFQLVMLFGGLYRLYWSWMDKPAFERDYAAFSAGMIAASGIMGVITSLIGFAPKTPWVFTEYLSYSAATA